MQTIYLDHNATTPVHPEVIEAMVRVYTDGLANPSSQHQPGQAAGKLLEDARQQIADLLGAKLGGSDGDRLVFTSSATEANNLTIFGMAAAFAEEHSRPGQVILSGIEHASVIEPAEQLLDQGWKADALPADSNGQVRADLLADWLGEQTALVSVMLGNHETGALQPVAEMAEVCNQRAVPLHTDAVQVVGKLPVHFRGLGVAALTLTAHKLGGPLGIGALLLRSDVPIRPILFGGPHEGGLRPGTPCVALAVGFRTALEIRQRQQQEHARHLLELRGRFEDGLRAACPGVVVHAENGPRLPQTTSVAFPQFDAEQMFIALDLSGVACSVGSACSSGSVELSPTLLAMGLSRDLVHRSLRFSFGETTTPEDIDEALRRIRYVYRELGGEDAPTAENLPR